MSDAAAYTLAGAFIVGLLAGALLTVRLFNVVARTWRRSPVGRSDEEEPE